MKEKPRWIEDRLENIHAALEKALYELRDLEEQLVPFLDDAQQIELQDVQESLADAVEALECV